MKKLMLVIVISIFTTNSYAQDKIHPQTKEYATVYLKIFYQTRTIEYDKKGWSKSPIISMPNGLVAFLYDATDKENLKELSYVNSVINYMAIYGWEVKNVIVLPYSGGSGGGSKSILVNTNQYLQEITFERPFMK